MLVHGNMLKDEAISLSKLVENTFTPEPLTPEELRSHRALIVPEGEYFGARYFLSVHLRERAYRRGASS